MHKSSKIATTRTLAKQLGISSSTVSRALRNDSRISAKTRERVHAAAKEVGYSISPFVSAFLTAQRMKRPRTVHETLAFITSETLEAEKAKAKIPYHIWLMLEKSAEEMGYRFKRYWIGDFLDNPKRLSRLLRNEGTHGVLIDSLISREMMEGFQFEHFSLSRRGFPQHFSELDHVSPNMQSSIRLACEQAIKRGYRRIAYTYDYLFDERSDHLYYASWQTCLALHPQHLLPVWRFEQPDPEALVAWYRETRPDCIITSRTWGWQELEEAGHRVPDEVAIIKVGLNPYDKGWAGVKIDFYETARNIVQLLHEQMMLNQTGFPKHPKTVLITPSWVEGETCRNAPGSLFK